MKQNRWARLALLLLLAASVLPASSRNSIRIAEDRGTAGTLAALSKLPVYVRVLQTIAHPDDESAGTLTWLSRKYHAQTALFCLTRGEGGQNILGKEKYEALGLVRTGELLAASEYYGTDLYFGKVLDFGFSKTGEETLSKWEYEETLEEMVHFIRFWRPTIIISRFQGSPADGHGHHQAAGVLTREAFHAAGNRMKYTEQIEQGLPHWQAQKLYVSARVRPGIGPDKNERTDSIIPVPVGDYNPVLGRSYRQIASDGYSQHRTQGTGASFAFPGQASEYFALLDSAIRIQENEPTFFDSIDTTLMAIWNLAGEDKEQIPFLRENLQKVQEAADDALRDFHISEPERSARAIAAGTAILRQTLDRIHASALSEPTKATITDALKDKLRDFNHAMQAVLGITVYARTEDATAVAGDSLSIRVDFFNRGSETVTLGEITAATRQNGHRVSPNDDLKRKILSGGSAASTRLLFEISPDATATEPFWFLKNNQDSRYTVKPTDNEFAPFGPPEIQMQVQYTYLREEFSLQATAMAQAGDPLRGPNFVDFQIVPAIAVSIDPEVAIIPAGTDAEMQEFRVTVINNLKGVAQGMLKLRSPSGWQVKPEGLPFSLTGKAKTLTATFHLEIPADAKPGRYFVEAVADMNGTEFRRGLRVVSYPGIWTRRLYSEARTRIERFDLKVSPNLTVGYVPGAGDDIPAALMQMGIQVETLSQSDLAFGDFARFSAIVIGIRAYNVNEHLRANNQRLLDYVAQGGTLIVQYMRPMGRRTLGSMGSDFDFGPFPMSLSSAHRITVEESPVRILNRTSKILSFPNQITESDFQNWVQERGLYFMNEWDPRYQTILSGNDPMDDPMDGGMLYAQYGKGHYIYTGYSWFRQLPAGVPGAFRIFANMLSLGSSP